MPEWLNGSAMIGKPESERTSSFVARALGFESLWALHFYGVNEMENCTDCADTGITLQTERPCTCAVTLRAREICGRHLGSERSYLEGDLDALPPMDAVQEALWTVVLEDNRLLRAARVVTQYLTGRMADDVEIRATADVIQAAMVGDG